MNNKQSSLFFIGFKAYIGKRVNSQWLQFKKDWMRNHKYPSSCSNCKVKLRRNEKRDNFRTLDHIIPKQIIYALDLPELLFDDEN